MVLFVLGFAAVMLPFAGPFALILLAAFCLWPYAIQVKLVQRLHTATAQLILAGSAVLYAGWFVYVYMSAVIWYPDALSGVLFFFMGFYAMLGLVPLWALAGVLEWRGRRRV